MQQVSSLLKVLPSSGLSNSNFWEIPVGEKKVFAKMRPQISGANSSGISPAVSIKIARRTFRLI
jgi:hypothetical protein